MLSKEPDLSIHKVLMENDLPRKKKLHKNIEYLVNTKGPDEAVNDIVDAAKEYAFNDVKADKDIKSIDEMDKDMNKEYQRIVSKELIKHIYRFFPMQFRESIVEYHSHGLTTSDAITYLIENNGTLFRLAQKDAIGMQKMRRFLIPRVSYLKPGHPLWPENKYGDLWRHGRYFKKAVTADLPFTNANEQVGVLINHIARLNSVMENSEFSVKELSVLTSALTKTLETIQKLTLNEQQMVDFSTEKLTIFIERISNALGPSGKIPENTDTRLLVEALEKLTHALRVPKEQKAITG